MRYTKNGAPRKAVRIPIGISVARRFLEMLSTSRRKLAPKSMDAGNRYRLSFPTIFRHKYLIGKPVSEETAEQAAQIALRDAEPLEQNAYKVQIAKTLVKRSILRLE